VAIWGIADARVVRAGDADDNIAGGGSGGASCGNDGPDGVRAIYRNVQL
jgi:hypothetical protein